MSRRCKPGQRARIISSSADRGAIVLVVRRYFGEVIGANGRTWVQHMFPWVVTSLGGPLNWCVISGTETGTSMTIVLDDSDLEPIENDGDSDDTSTERDKPLKRPIARRNEALRQAS